MNRETIINGIINNRQKQQEEIIKRLNSLSAITGALEELKEKSQDMQSRMKEDPATCDKLRRVDEKIDSSADLLDKLKQELRRLKARTTRDTINIGIVGVPKQGKSTFLQALTGLDEATIPTGNDYVTGACSYIRHDSSVATGDAYAIVTPYSKKEFRDEVLRPFCRAFNLELDSVDDLPNLNLPEKDTLEKEAQKRILERLEQLKEDYGKYKELLGQGDKRIPKEEIRRYVAQCDEQCRTKYTNWYAIKKAEIHCCFPQQDIGRLMICDTPGLGDFTPGAKQALMEKLSSDMDIIFFMKRLDPGDQTIDEKYTEFYDVVKESNRVFGVQDWAYMVLNCRAGDTPTDRFLDDLNAKLQTRELKVLDARDASSVSSQFDSILQDIVSQIPKLDNKLMKNYAELTGGLKTALEEVAALAKVALPTFSPAIEGLELSEKTDTILNNLEAKFQNMKAELEENGGSLSPDVKNIITAMRANCPILNHEERDKEQPATWFNDGKSKLRAAFISAFSGLDIPMQKMVDDARAKLRDILTRQDGGRLAFVLTGKEDADFWKTLKEILLNDLGDKASGMIQAIKNIETFKMQFRAFILPRLTSITNRLSNAPKYEATSFAIHMPGDTLEHCRTKLETAWQEALAESEEIFDTEEENNVGDILGTPAAALAALVDEFYLLWTKHEGYNKANRRWHEFYRAHAPEVWPEIFKSDTSMLALSRTWNSEVKAFSSTISKFI